MRFISPSGRLRLVLIHDKTVPDPVSGFTHTTVPGYTVEFKQGLLDGFERKLARERLRFPGGVTDRQNLDGSPFDYIQMAGVFDSKWIEDEDLRERVEEKLLANDGFGKEDTFILVEQPRQPIPWASYDQLTIHGRRTAEHVAEKNLEIAAVTGVSIEDLIGYENENRNDSRILALYEAALTADDSEPELVVQA